MIGYVQIDSADGKGGYLVPNEPWCVELAKRLVAEYDATHPAADVPLRCREPQLSMVDTVDGSDADGERRRAER